MPGPQKSPQHMEKAKPVMLLGLLIAGSVSGMCVAGGIAAMLWNAASPTEIKLFGATLSTGNVGVAFVFVGVVALTWIIRYGLKTLVQLAKL